MIKRLLVYFFVFALCSNIWANDSVVQSGKEAKAEAKEYSRSDIVKMMNIKDKFDYSYESHTDIAYDLYGENKHVNRRLSKEEQSKYYADPLGYMESIAKNDWQRAFEMSMYYQGWKPNTIFFRFDFFNGIKEFNYMPTTDDMRFKERKVLDAQKALLWAKIAYDLFYKSTKGNISIMFSNDNLILTNYFYRRLDTEDENTVIKEFMSIEEDSRSAKNLIYDYKSYKNAEYKNISISKYTFVYYNFYFWRNYYCGFVLPKDKDVAFMSIFTHKEELDKNLAIYKLQSGFFDKEERNEAELKSSITRIIQSIYREKTEIRDGLIFKYSIKNYILNSCLDRDLYVFKNPFYNKETALEEARRLTSNYDPLKEKLFIFDYNSNEDILHFIKHAPYYGIDEDIYNDILEIFYTNKDTHAFKQYEKLARTWFNGQASHWQDYK